MTKYEKDVNDYLGHDAYSLNRASATHFPLIRQWAKDRNLIEGANKHAQMLKMTEEVGELAHGIARNNYAEIKDAIGDCVVVLTILAEQNGFSIESAIESAYNEIKNRKGKMVNGVFVKEE